MKDAIHEKTGETIRAFDAWEKFKEPHKENYYCCELHKYPVTPVIDHERSMYGEKVYIISHFRMNSNHYCPGESDEHWNLKVTLAGLIQTKKIKIKNNIYDFKPTKLDDLIEVRKGQRRADVLVEFNDFNSFFGYGIIFEIAITENIDSLINKTKDWINYGYSVDWKHQYDKYDNLNRQIEIKCPFGLYRDTVK